MNAGAGLRLRGMVRKEWLQVVRDPSSIAIAFVLPLLLLLASLGGLVWALAFQRKGDGPLSMRAVPFGVFACTAAWATVPLWPWISGR